MLRLSNKAGGGQGGGIPCSILVSIVSVFSDSCSGCSGGFVPVVSGFSTCLQNWLIVYKRILYPEETVLYNCTAPLLCIPFVYNQPILQPEY